MGSCRSIKEANGIKGDKGEIGITGPQGPTGAPTATDSITNTHLANMPAGTLKGATNAGDPQDLSALQAWGLLGGAGKATTAQAQAGTDDAQFMTALKVAQANVAQHPGALGTTGWQKLPSGLIIQWGTVPGGEGAIWSMFPIKFPSALMSVITNPIINRGGVLVSCLIADWNVTGFAHITTYTDTKGGGGFAGEHSFYIALGY